MRTLQEWMGHRDFTTTLVYADFAPDPAGGAALAERALGRPPRESVPAAEVGSQIFRRMRGTKGRLIV